jgi:hypothetical protein
VVKRATKVTALLLASLAGAGGCAQVFGLGDYGQLPPDAGEDGAVDATSPGDSGNGDSAAPDAPSQRDAAGDAGPRPDAQAPDAGDGGLDGPVFSADGCSGATTCAPVAPAGWTGPLALWEGTGTPPACSAYYVPAFEGGLSLGVTAAQCSCSCTTPSGSTCGSVSVQFGTGNCGSSCGSTSIPQGACASVQTLASGCGAGAGFTISGSTATGGSCQPDASVTLPPPTWAMQASACAPASESPLGCAAGQQCVPAAPAPFEPHFCVMKAGTNTCVSPFTVTHTYYGGFDDTRGCTPCTCGAPSGVDCNTKGHVTTWGNPNCTANMGADLTPLPRTCQATASEHSMRFTTSPEGGSCPPGGGQPTGTVAASTLTTICCTP